MTSRVSVFVLPVQMLSDEALHEAYWECRHEIEARVRRNTGWHNYVIEDDPIKPQ